VECLQYRVAEAVKRAGLADFRFHDLRHTWASWHRQAGTSTDELKDLWWLEIASDGGPLREFGTEHLSAAASRIESVSEREDVTNLLRFRYGPKKIKAGVCS
jgi:hypothetical protein